MINWAIRYQPFVEELHRIQPPWVLDIGSGAEGIKLFWRGNVNGVDINFKRRPLHRGILGSALELPIANRSCPVVVCCDLLEHIHPNQRDQVIKEISRVADEHILLGFPCGEASMETYKSIANGYSRSKPPQWLQDHLELGLPDASHVEGRLHEAGWATKTISYESTQLHERLVNLEMRLGGKFITYGMMRLIGPEIIAKFNFSQEGSKMRVLIKASR